MTKNSVKLTEPIVNRGVVPWPSSVEVTIGPHPPPPIASRKPPPKPRGTIQRGGSDTVGRCRSAFRRIQELVSRELGVTAAELSGWRDAFLAAGETSLKTRPADGRDVEIGRLKAKVGDLTMSNELLTTKIDHLEAGRPLARRRSRR